MLQIYPPSLSFIFADSVCCSSKVFNFFKKIFCLFIFRETGREGERERNINVWCPVSHSLLETWFTTQACALDWELNPRLVRSLWFTGWHSIQWATPAKAVLFFKKHFIYLFLERGEGRENERERNIDVWEKLMFASCMPPTGDLACNPSMCPEWELNLWPFVLHDNAQPIEPSQSWQLYVFFIGEGCFFLLVDCWEFSFYHGWMLNLLHACPAPILMTTFVFLVSSICELLWFFECWTNL